MHSTYYFSTQGCRFWESLETAALDEEAPLVAATAAARALLSKKFAISPQGHDADSLLQYAKLGVRNARMIDSVAEKTRYSILTRARQVHSKR